MYKLGHFVNDKTKEKIRQSRIGMKFSDKHKIKLSLAKLGKKRKPFTDETRKKMVLAFTGRKASLKTIKKLSESHLGQKSWNKGVPMSEEVREKVAHTFFSSERVSGENNINWAGGKSFEEYPREWNEILKEKIRDRDGRICQKCGKTEEEELKEYGRKLAVNHINFDKRNCKEWNLNLLCLKCNLEINNNRKFWGEYFSQKMVERGLTNVNQ